MQVLVTGNEGDNDLGLVGSALAGLGARPKFVVREAVGAWPTLDGFDLVVSLGSECSAYSPAVQTAVEAECALLRTAHERGMAVFAICFGSQLLAQALGGVVERSPLPELGWYGVTPTDAADAGIAPGPWFQWHYDRWLAPPEAEVLARSPISNQAFRLGRSVGVQFHPEVTTAVVEQWVGGNGAAELARLGLDREALLARCITEAPAAAERTNALIAFLARQW